MKTLYASLIFLFSSSLIISNPPPVPSAQETGHILVNNRILAKVGDRTLSVIDVMKKMDMLLMQGYPDLVHSLPARYQFYSSQWRSTLKQMVHTELMLADAESIELKVTDADVRETMLNKFGPHVMATLDTLNLSYEEAREMIHAELVMQRMTWYRVHSKALQKVHSQDIKSAYLAFCANHPPLEEWKYQVFSVRSTLKEVGAKVAQKAHTLLTEKHQALQDVASLLQEPTPPTEESVSVAVSQEYTANEKTLSAAHKEVLENLSVGSYSTPIAQVSRADQSVVHRIFFLKEYKKSEIPSFEKVFDKLHEELLEQAASEENALYTAKLRERFGYDDKMLEEIPEDFQPFTLVYTHE